MRLEFAVSANKKKTYFWSFARRDLLGVLIATMLIQEKRLKKVSVKNTKTKKTLIDMTSENKKVQDLRFVRALSPDYVPRYLIEQIKQRDYEVDDFYTYQKANCLTESKDGFLINPLNHLWVLVDSKNNVKGVLWFTVDPLTKNVLIQNYSIDKEYWNQDAVGKLKEHMDEILCKADLHKVYWLTTYPKHSQKHGFKRSKAILMEYEYGKDNDGISSEQGDSSVIDSPATTVPRRDVGSSATADVSSGASGHHEAVHA